MEIYSILREYRNIKFCLSEDGEFAVLFNEKMIGMSQSFEDIRQLYESHKKRQLLTELPDKIENRKQAERYLASLYNNGESYHPDDSSFDICWGLVCPTKKQMRRMDKLMDQIRDIKGFDPCVFLLELNGHEIEK